MKKFGDFFLKKIANRKGFVISILMAIIAHFLFVFIYYFLGYNEGTGSTYLFIIGIFNSMLPNFLVIYPLVIAYEFFFHKTKTLFLISQLFLFVVFSTFVVLFVIYKKGIF